MANTKSAKKQARQNIRRHKRNLARRTAIKTAVKKVLIALEQGAQMQESQALLNDISAKLARAQSKGVMHSNTASRKISRLTKRFNSTYSVNQTEK